MYWRGGALKILHFDEFSLSILCSPLTNIRFIYILLAYRPVLKQPILSHWLIFFVNYLAEPFLSQFPSLVIPKRQEQSFLTPAELCLDCIDFSLVAEIQLALNDWPRDNNVSFVVQRWLISKQIGPTIESVFCNYR